MRSLKPTGTAVLAAALAAAAQAQQAVELRQVQAADGAQPCQAPEHGQLDFWVGEWNLSWEAPDGTRASGSNSVERILGGCAVAERFDGGAAMPLRGRSLSTYDPDAQQWTQVWVDDRGARHELIGGPVGDEFVLETMPFGAEGQNMYRMRFTDIRPGSLTWLWQLTRDRGQSWETKWRIDYARAEGEDEPGEGETVPE